MELRPQYNDLYLEEEATCERKSSVEHELIVLEEVEYLRKIKVDLNDRLRRVLSTSHSYLSSGISKRL